MVWEKNKLNKRKEIKNMKAIIESETALQKGVDLESIPCLKEVMESDIIKEIEPVIQPSEEHSTIMVTNEMVEEEIKRIHSMNFIELLQFERQLEQQKQYLADAKDTIDQLYCAKEKINLLENEGKDTFSAKLIAADAEAKIDLPEDNITSFLDNYDVSIERIDQTIEETKKRISEFDDIKKTSTFMNQAMLEIVEKKLTEIFELEKNGRTDLKTQRRYYLEQKIIFSNRDSVDFILNKIPEKKIFLKRWIKSFKKEKQQNLKNSQMISSTQKQVTKAFCSVFSIQQMQAFEKYLKKILVSGDNDSSVFLMQYMMYIIYTDEKIRKKGQSKWIESLIMNVLDILNDAYDLPNGVEYFNGQLKKIENEVMKDLPKIKL